MATALHGLLAIGDLVCFILVVIEMFKRGRTAMGVLCLVSLLVCGVGMLAVFIIGWINARAWNIQNIMIAWTVLIVLGIAANFAVGPPQIPGLTQ